MKENFFPSRIIEIVGMLLISLLLGTPYFSTVGKGLPTEKNILIFFALVGSIFIGISILVNISKKQKMEWNFKIVDFRYLYLMLIIILIFQIGFNSSINNLIHFLSRNKTELSNPFLNMYFVLDVVIIGPILEELICRGIILKGLLTRYSPKWAIIISTIIFGLLHEFPLQMCGAFLIGLFLGWIYYKTKSIGTVILLHSFANFSILGYKYMNYRYSDSYPISSVNILLIILSVPILIFMIRKLVIKITTFKSVTIIDAIYEVPLNPHN